MKETKNNTLKKSDLVSLFFVDLTKSEKVFFI